jgi:exodeoxyribonuclease V alpha subunit
MSDARLVRVSSIRSHNPKGFGGYIFYGRVISSAGAVLDAKENLVVVVRSELAVERIEIGQWWNVTGAAVPRERIRDGYRIIELQVVATNLEMVLPSGEHLVTFIAESEAFPGFGMVKARRLWERFGEQLYEILDRGDIAVLSSHITLDAARVLVSGWQRYGDARTLLWLSRMGIDVELGRKIVAFFGPDTPQSIEADPYRLLSFSASWQTTDQIARAHFKVAEDDERRLRGAVEEALYRLLADGHTAATLEMVEARLLSVLGNAEPAECRRLLSKALEAGKRQANFIVTDDGIFHPVGAYIMEQTAASTFADRLSKTPTKQPPLLDRISIDVIISDYEREECVTLTDEQRAAVHLAARNKLAVLTGGAGVGKTTVLKCIYRIFDQANVAISQAALAGLAAKRMQLATGRPALTLASLLRRANAETFSGACVVVVDEASMVDIVTMYRLCMLIEADTRLLMVGDPMQLMPVGPGIVLHALSGDPRVPEVAMRVPKRFAGEIARVADSVRDGVWPIISSDLDAPVSFISHAPMRRSELQKIRSAIATTVLGLYQIAPHATQILSPRKQGHDGVHALNLGCQQIVNSDARRLMIRDTEHAVDSDTGFRLGDPVVCTRNLYEHGLQNGALGRITKIEGAPTPVTNQTGHIFGEAIAWIEWDDGETRPVFASLLEYLELAYALTVHKAQGSQWERVIIPITGHRLLDRSLIYTALTRAQRQVIFVGDENAARLAVERPPRTYSRTTYLQVALAERLRSSMDCT